MSGAHDASVDTDAAEDVLYAMLEEYGYDGASPEELYDLCFPDAKHWCGPSNHFMWEPWGLSFGFGKAQGEPLATFDDNGYLGWILKNSFPVHVKEIVQTKLHWRRGADALHEELHAKHGGLRQEPVHA